MKRPSRITTLLVATGVPPLAFTVALFDLGSIPEDVAPYLTIALVLIPASVFLPLSAFLWFRHIVKTGRQRFQKAIPTSCIICGQPLPQAPLRRVRQVQGPHYQAVHPDFWRWEVKSRKVFLTAFLAPFPVTFYELALANSLLAILPTALSVTLAMVWNRLEKRKVRSFRSQWSIQQRTLT